MVPDWLPSLLSTIAFHVSIIIFPSFYLLHQVDSKRNCCNGKMATDRPTPNPQKQTNKQTKETKRKKNSVKKRGQMRKKKKVLNGARGTMTRAGRSHRRQSIGRLIDRSIDASTANHGEGWAGGWAGQGCACGPSVCQPMVSTGLALISQS